MYARAVDAVAGDAAWSEFFGDRHGTHFVPTDRAFAKLGAAHLRRTFDSAACLRRVLDDHRADRVLPTALLKERGWRYESLTRNGNAILLVRSNGGDKFTVGNIIRLF